MRLAVEAYTGPVTKLQPGIASGKVMPASDKTSKYLREHEDDPPGESAEARRQRMAQAKRDRITKRNAPILKRIAKQERLESKYERNLAIIKKANEEQPATKSDSQKARERQT